MGKSENTRYSFETAPTRQTLKRAAEMTQKLLIRLGIDDQIGSVSADDERLLSAFTTACHLNIDWYDRHRKRQQRYYWAFGIFTGLVVIAMPVAIFLAHSKAADALAGQIGVIITGVLSAHRMLASTLEKRNMARHFWKAQADLKSILYAFEDKWRDCCWNAGEAAESGASAAAGQSEMSASGASALTLKSAFLDDLERATKESLEIKKQEQELFFSQNDTPFSNISEILGLVQRSGTSLIEAKQQEGRDRSSLDGRVRELQAIMATLKGQMATMDSEMATLASSTERADVDRHANLRRSREGLEGRLLTLEVELAVARHKVEQFDS